MNTSSWSKLSLGEHVDLLTGFPFKSKSFTNDPLDIPLVKGDNVQQGYIDWNVSKRWPRDNTTDFEKYRLKVGDVVLAMDRPWIESGLKFAWIKKHDPECLLVQRVARLRGDELLITDYVRYLIASPAFTSYIRPIVTGVNVPHISPRQIKDFKFLLPPVDVQAKAVAILSAFDNLIENDLRRIKILEEIARTIFTEWFANFRFPGHYESRFVGTSAETIPDNWTNDRLDGLTEIRKGRQPRELADKQENGQLPYILIDVLKGGTPRYASQEGAVVCAQEDTLMVMDGASSGLIVLVISGIVITEFGRQFGCSVGQTNH